MVVSKKYLAVLLEREQNLLEPLSIRLVGPMLEK
jgi:hypothetical protein